MNTICSSDRIRRTSCGWIKERLASCFDRVRDEPRAWKFRLPVPVSMWRPWEQWTSQVGGVPADFFANPVVELSGKRIAPIICYEQLVVWPILHSILNRPELVVLIGNGWWTAGGNIVAIQRASARAWADLFAIPLVISFNT